MYDFLHIVTKEMGRYCFIQLEDRGGEEATIPVGEAILFGVDWEVWKSDA